MKVKGEAEGEGLIAQSYCIIDPHDAVILGPQTRSQSGTCDHSKDVKMRPHSSCLNEAKVFCKGIRKVSRARTEFKSQRKKSNDLYDDIPPVFT